jgi:hypothetical protein
MSELPSEMVQRMTISYVQRRQMRESAMDAMQAVLVEELHLPELLEALQFYSREAEYSIARVYNDAGIETAVHHGAVLLDNGAIARAVLEKVGVMK